MQQIRQPWASNQSTYPGHQHAIPDPEFSDRASEIALKKPRYIFPPTESPTNVIPRPPSVNWLGAFGKENFTLKSLYDPIGTIGLVRTLILVAVIGIVVNLIISAVLIFRSLTRPRPRYRRNGMYEQESRSTFVDDGEDPPYTFTINMQRRV